MHLCIHEPSKFKSEIGRTEKEGKLAGRAAILDRMHGRLCVCTVQVDCSVSLSAGVHQKSAPNNPLPPCLSLSVSPRAGGRGDTVV